MKGFIKKQANEFLKANVNSYAKTKFSEKNFPKYFLERGLNEMREHLKLVKKSRKKNPGFYFPSAEKDLASRIEQLKRAIDNLGELETLDRFHAQVALLQVLSAASRKPLPKEFKYQPSMYQRVETVRRITRKMLTWKAIKTNPKMKAQVTDLLEAFNGK
jgi:hypothetical protein